MAKYLNEMVLFFLVGSIAAEAQLTVSFSTKSYGGTYMNNGNILAVYVKKSDGSFVKTIALTEEAGPNLFYLKDWWDATGGDSSNIDADAKMGATRVDHFDPEVVTTTWNLKDQAGKTMPDGDYLICFNLTEGGDVYHQFTFTKDQNGGIRTDPGNEYFYNISISYSPEMPTIVDRDTDGMDDIWESENGLNTTLDDSALDPDKDGATNYSEYLAGTNPQSSSSVFKLVLPSFTSSEEVKIMWNSVRGKTYALEYADILGASAVWRGSITNIVAAPPVNTSSVPASAEARFYRITLE